ncbi:MAG: DUF3618 domain-containing protein [Pseudomonadota bacterium]
MHRDTRELEHRADRARDHLERTLEDLERRFSPGQMIDTAMATIRENGGDFGRNLSTQVRNNPLPLLVTGVGLAWLISASGRPPERAQSAGPSLGERASGIAAKARGAAARSGDGGTSAAQGAREKVGSAASGARNAVSGMAGSSRQTAQRLGQASRSGMRSLGDGYAYLSREQPLALGALGIAAGALIGAMMPATRAEDEWIGEHSEEATERLKEEGRKRVEEAQATAAQAAEAARQPGEPKPAGRSDTSGGSEGGVASASD